VSLAGEWRARSAKTGLTAYGKSYLDGVVMAALPLATLDAALRPAADAEGVALPPA
jgi:hypothetical protein